jgi:hypothetical protein
MMQVHWSLARRWSWPASYQLVSNEIFVSDPKPIFLSDPKPHFREGPGIDFGEGTEIVSRFRGPWAVGAIFVFFLCPN